MKSLDHIESVRDGSASAVEWVEQAITQADASVEDCIFTSVLSPEAHQHAQAIAENPAGLALAGMPFAAKNLFDVAGEVTLAGAKINLGNPPAAQTATIISRLQEAGAVLVGLTNMDEFAYGFSTENAHFGATRNPHDKSRIAGGSSGGSAAAVAAGIVPFALGSDTNGSIRVPASLCGIFGFKPTYGRLSRAGTYPFVASLDHVGSFARTVDDLSLTYDVMVGSDPLDPICTKPAPEATYLEQQTDPGNLRVGVLDGWFRQGATPEALKAVDMVASSFADVKRVTLEGAEMARSAAFCMTAIEGGSLHAERLKQRAMDFDPAVRDRLMAGLLMPAYVMEQVRRVRRLFNDEMTQAFGSFDFLIAPATPCSAPKVGEATVIIDDKPVPVRANLGIYTQPVSFVGLPVVCAPVDLQGMPIGVQLIGPHWSESLLLRVAKSLEARGVCQSRSVPSEVAV